MDCHSPIRQGLHCKFFFYLTGEKDKAMRKEEKAERWSQDQLGGTLAMATGKQVRIDLYSVKE